MSCDGDNVKMRTLRGQHSLWHSRSNIGLFLNRVILIEDGLFSRNDTSGRHFCEMADECEVI